MMAPNTPHPGMGFKEFVALIAALMATNALAIDSMLPALGQIGHTMGLKNPNQAQLIITFYLLGMGGAQILYGTLSDRFGRRPILLAGLVGYTVCSLLVAFSHSFGAVLAARAMQGVAAASSRVISVSVVRDCYSGRLMARVMSLALIVFISVPVLAPSTGQLIMLLAPWQAIFVGLAAFGLVLLVWVWLRLPETLNKADNETLTFRTITHTFGVVLGNRQAMGYTLATTMIFGAMLGFINSAQQLFSDQFHAERYFPATFALVAVFIALSSLINARLVDWLGMRELSHGALLAFILIAAVHVVIAISGHETIWSFAAMQSGAMFCLGLMTSNFGAIAMQPMGRVAGAAASVQGFVSTLGAAILGWFLGQRFNGSDVPLEIGFVAYGLLGLVCVMFAEGGRLFRRHESMAEAR